jgi:hypothetical protein
MLFQDLFAWKLSLDIVYFSCLFCNIMSICEKIFGEIIFFKHSYGVMACLVFIVYVHAGTVR